MGLEYFNGLVSSWFGTRIGEPTDVQARAWPVIAGGEHVLLTAPTGSGKTFAAFLWGLNQLLTDAWPRGSTRILYVSPLKALNNDMQRNLWQPLRGLKRRFEEAARPFPEIRVMTRSGDTPQAERRSMVKRPPEILITTPESLNLLLSSARGRSVLTELRTVILDEIHSIIGNKRGTHCITAVERLTLLSGEFQRIGLSATVRTPGEVCSFLGGFRRVSLADGYRMEPRAVHHVGSRQQKDYQITISVPGERETGMEKAVWEGIVAALRPKIEQNTSTLIFTNNRRLCERITHLINRDSQKTIAWSHHGSLSREIRADVEFRLKHGELKAIVATNSLELGIDIGFLDEVILIQSPPSVSAAIQRIGRAGHRVGEISRGTFFPSHHLDCLEAVVLAGAIGQNAIEPVHPVINPLDVLAQIILSMVALEDWQADALYEQIRTAWPYHTLTREQFDLVLEMLAGSYERTRIRELQPRVSIDRIEGTVSSLKGVRMLLSLSGGTIPDRGYFTLRHLKTGGRIGELDEEFVWETAVGKNFTLGAQNWRIEKITQRDVFVLPSSQTSLSSPFWKGEGFNRDFHYSRMIADFLDYADRHLDEEALVVRLQEKDLMSRQAAEGLIDFLRQQRRQTGTSLPHARHLVVEIVARGPGRVPGNQIVLHTFWGGRVNRPYALALSAAWEERFGSGLEVFPSNDCIVIMLPEETAIEDMIRMVSASNVMDLLRKSLEGSGIFGAQFREAAGRSLLLTKSRFRERQPLWMTRLRSQKLLTAVKTFNDFPLLLEAWRACLHDIFDIPSLQSVLRDIEDGTIRWSVCHTLEPSPMAAGVSWRQINQYMYMGDEPKGDTRTGLREDLLGQVALSPEIRPKLPPERVRRFLAKRQRLETGYSPSPKGLELIDFIRDRVFIGEAEWSRLDEALTRDHEEWTGILDSRLNPHLVWIIGTEGRFLTVRDLCSFVVATFFSETHLTRVTDWEGGPLDEIPVGPHSGPEPDEQQLRLFMQWFHYHGPLSIEQLRRMTGLTEPRLRAILSPLLISTSIVRGSLIEGSDEELFCDRDLFEQLLRIMRRDARSSVKPLSIDQLPFFLARFQGLTGQSTATDKNTLADRLELLCGYSLPVQLWETDILPCRIGNYQPGMLDSLLQETGLRWFGTGSERLTFAWAEDEELFPRQSGTDAIVHGQPAGESDALFNRDEEERPALDIGTSGAENGPRSSLLEKITRLFPQPQARYDFQTLLTISGMSVSELLDVLWQGVWQGLLGNDSFWTIRQGIDSHFQADPASWSFAGRTRRGRFGTARRRGRTVHMTGNWYRRIAPDRSDHDAIRQEEQRRERVRILLERYGILFRELLERELPEFRWQAILRSLIMMEYAGEVIGGCFFDAIPGPQFISPHALNVLVEQPNIEADIFWINAMDPASACGLDRDLLPYALPRRLPGNHLVYRGSTLIFVSERMGRELTFTIEPDDEDTRYCVDVLKRMLERKNQPLSKIIVERINQVDAGQSPYLPLFQKHFDLNVDLNRLIIRPSRRSLLQSDKELPR